MLGEGMVGEGAGAAFCAAQNGAAIAAARAAITMIRMLFCGNSMPDVTTPPCDSLQRLPSIRLEGLSDGGARDSSGLDSIPAIDGFMRI